MVKIGEQLSELKKASEELNRLMGLRKETFWVEGKEKIVISTEELSKQIEEKQKKVREMKLSIQENNLKTKVGEVTLAEAILQIADLRKEISALSDLKNNPASYREEKEIKKPQMNLLQIEKIIAQKENEKTKLDSQIQSINWQDSK